MAMGSTASEANRFPSLLWLTNFAALLGSVQFGYHLGVLNTPLAFVAADLNFTVTLGGAVVVSALLVGAAVGSLFAGQTADAIGPKRALLLNNVLLAAGSLLSACSPAGFWGMALGRFTAGLGSGAASLFVPRYIAEIAPASIRGALGTMNQCLDGSQTLHLFTSACFTLNGWAQWGMDVFINVGILAAYLAGLPYSSNHPESAVFLGFEMAWWRVMFLIAVLPAAIQAVLLSVLPESGVWLAWKGQHAAAKASRRALLGERWQADGIPKLVEEGGAAGEADASRLLSGTTRSDAGAGARHDSAPAGPDSGVPSTGQDAADWSAVFGKKYRKMVVLAAGLPLWQQLSGINTVILYSSQVFREAGLSNPVVGSVLMGIVNVAVTLVAAILMDRFGRKPLLLASHGGMAFFLVALAAIISLSLPKSVEASVLLSCVLAYVASFAIGVGPIPWVYISEILPENIKGKAAALATSLNWVACLVVGLAFPVMLKLLNIAGSYAVYAVLNVAALVFVWRLMVETKRKTLAEVSSLLLVED